MLRIIIPIFQMNRKHTGTVGAHPLELGGKPHFAPLSVYRLVHFESASEYEVLNTELRKDLWELRNVAEMIGSIACASALAKFIRERRSDHEIAHRSFSVGQIKIVLQIPRTHPQISRSDIFFQQILVLRTHNEIIFEHDRLRVEMENITVISFKQRKKLIDKVDEL